MNRHLQIPEICTLYSHILVYLGLEPFGGSGKRLSRRDQSLLSLTTLVHMSCSFSIHGCHPLPPKNATVSLHARAQLAVHERWQHVHGGIHVAIDDRGGEADHERAGDGPARPISMAMPLLAIRK